MLYSILWLRCSENILYLQKNTDHSCVENTSQVRSLLPVGVGPIYNGGTPNIGIGITNFKISVRIIMT